MKPILTITLLFLSSISFTANAQTKKLLNVEEAIQIALNHNAQVKAGDLELKASRYLKKTAGELPKLDFNAQLGQYNSVKSDQSFQLAQTIPFPTLFGAKKLLIDAEIKGKEVQREMTVLELKYQVRLSYYQILYLQHHQKQLQQLDSLYTDFSRIAALRYKTGDTKKVDVSTADTKKGEIHLLLKQNEVYLANAYINLQGLMYIDETIEVTDTDSFKPLQVSDLLGDSLVSNHPTVQSLYQEAMIAEQSKKVEKAQGLPDFTIGYVNQSLIGFQNIQGIDRFFDRSKRFNSVSIGITIPLTFGATKARIKSLDFKKQAAEANAQQQQRTLVAQFKNAMLQYQQDRLQYTYFKQQALPNAKEMISAAQLGYKTGDIGYVEYLYALQTATDIQLGYLKSIQQINKSVINIYSLINQ